MKGLEAGNQNSHARAFTAGIAGFPGFIKIPALSSREVLQTQSIL